MNEPTPVLLLIFNRPVKTRRVVEALREVRPSRLYIAADGPRPGRPDDEENCRQARQAATAIDWPCEVKTRFLDNNIGCGLGVSSAIGWFFDHVEKGVILEDDCLPHPHFFPFCREMLDRYAQDLRIMNVCGLSPYSTRNYPYDYHFSRRFHCTGWATWRRAWNCFSYDMNLIDEAEFAEMTGAYHPFHFRRRSLFDLFQQAKSGQLKTWAFRWDVACFAQNGLSIIPERNLITNIGFDAEATHTKQTASLFADLDTFPLEFPLRHPPFVFADGRPGEELDKAIHRTLPFRRRCGERLRHALGMMVDFSRTMP